MTICDKTLEQLWSETPKGENCIAVDLYGAVFVMKGLAEAGPKRAFGLMHETSNVLSGEPNLYAHDKNVWKHHVPKTKFYGAVLFDRASNIIIKPCQFFESKEQAKEAVSENQIHEVIGWEILSHPVKK